jgi:glucose repression regulatory protein TUP1
MWDIAEWSIQRVFVGHTDNIICLDFSRDGRFIVSGSVDTTARIWDTESDNVLVLSPTVPPGVYANVYSVAISPDMKLVAAGCWDGIVRIWDVDTGHLVEQLEGHTESVWSVAFTSDGKGLISGSNDRTMKHWDLTGFMCNPDRDQPLSATICADPTPASSSADSSAPSPPESAKSGTTVLVDAASTNGHGSRGSVCSLDFVGHKDYVEGVAVSLDGQWVVSGSRDQDVRIWNSSTAELVMLLRGHKCSGELMDVQFGAELCYMLTTIEISLVC